MTDKQEAMNLTLKKIAEDNWLSEIRDYLPSAWIGHAPFLKYLIRELKPKNFVELGTHFGFSYFVACETVRELGLSTKCTAIDRWSGDKHAGFYDDSVFDSVVSLNKKYKNFSQLLRMTFLEARREIQEPIELLHIDGLHTYEAVKDDFETWLPKMSPNGIILLHDIHVRRSDFGVYKLWEEIKVKFQTLEFVGSYGLGVVFLGEIRSKEVLNIKEYSDQGLLMQVQGVFENHSDVALQNYRERVSKESNSRINDLESEIQNLTSSISESNLTQEYQAKHYMELSSKINKLESENESLLKLIKKLNGVILAKEVHLKQILNSKSWLITKPLRRLAVYLRYGNR